MANPSPIDIPRTYAEYFMLEGFSPAEAKRMEREMIAQKLAEEALYDAMEGDACDWL
jgi:hypothetical protein